VPDLCVAKYTNVAWPKPKNGPKRPKRVEHWESLGNQMDSKFKLSKALGPLTLPGWCCLSGKNLLMQSKSG
jgi:hypothetical protein